MDPGLRCMTRKNNCQGSTTLGESSVDRPTKNLYCWQHDPQIIKKRVHVSPGSFVTISANDVVDTHPFTTLKLHLRRPNERTPIRQAVGSRQRSMLKFFPALAIIPDVEQESRFSGIKKTTRPTISGAMHAAFASGLFWATLTTGSPVANATLEYSGLLNVGLLWMSLSYICNWTSCCTSKPRLLRACLTCFVNWNLHAHSTLECSGLFYYVRLCPDLECLGDWMP